MEYYTLQPGPLKIIEGHKQSTAVLGPLQDLLKMMPCSYTLLSPLQVEVGLENGSVTMKYALTNNKADPIEVKGSSVEEAERLLRSALGEAWRRYVVISNSSPHINGEVQAIGEELSDLIEH